MNSPLVLAGVGIVMVLVQVLAALPWLLVLFWNDVLRVFRSGKDPSQGVLAAPAVGAVARQQSRATVTTLLGIVAVVVVVGGLAWAGLLYFVKDSDWNAFFGRVYGSVLQLQLSVGLVIGVLAGLLLVWPKGGAVALSAFREGVRQLMFIILVLGTIILVMPASVIVPYFTFGEDHKMMQELGYETIMLVTVLFGCLTASTSISDEIEGRTAITLMSKPVSRRQFLLGKFAGLLLVCVLITLVLGWWFDWMLYVKRGFDKLDPVAPPELLTTTLQGWTLPREALDCLRGVGLWFFDVNGALSTMPGLFLGCVQTMILLALAVSLATRLPMVVNLGFCLALYIMGHLTPIMVQLAASRHKAAYLTPTPDNPPAVAELLRFASNVFDAVIPSLEFFNLGPTVVRDTYMPLVPFLWYVGSVGLYGVMYTAILLIAGLVLFEDRDLA